MIDERIDRPSRSPEDIARLTADALAHAHRQIDAVVAPEHATFDELFGALDDAARTVTVAYGECAFLRLVADDPQVRDAADEASTTIEKWRAAIPQRTDVANAIARFAVSPDAQTLGAKQAALSAAGRPTSGWPGRASRRRCGQRSRRPSTT